MKKILYHFSIAFLLGHQIAAATEPDIIQPSTTESSATDVQEVITLSAESSEPKLDDTESLPQNEPSVHTQDSANTTDQLNTAASSNLPNEETVNTSSEPKKKKKSKQKKHRNITQTVAETVSTITDKSDLQGASTESDLTVIEEKSPLADEVSRPLTEEEKDQPIFMDETLKPWNLGDPDELLEFRFENAELSSLITYIEKRFGLTFILDDAIKPLPQGGKSAVGTKISFSTNQPMTKKDAWSVFTSFLDMAGLTAQPTANKRVYRITTNDPRSPLSVTRGPLPTFIGSDSGELPSDDTRIRYVYFVENTSIDVVKNVLDSLRSATSPNLIIVPELRAIIITDKAYNIKTMLEVVHELDRITVPETMSVIKLKRADATKVAELYKAITKEDQQSLASRLLGGRRPSTASYFPEGTRIIAEPRTNTLILLGTSSAIKKIEDFIITEVDKEVDIRFSPFFVYSLKYVEADAIANILRDVLSVQTEGSDVSKFGGVRAGDKFFGPVTIVPEKSGNRLIIFAAYEDRTKIVEVIEQIDIEMPQIAIKCAFLNVDINDNKDFGVQMRNKIGGTTAAPDPATGGIAGLIGPNVTFQTSGLGGSPVIENSTTTFGAQRLLGNLVNLAKISTSPGTTYVTLGTDAYDVWGMLRFLETYSHVNVMATPFMVTTHKYPAQVIVGETRRILTGTTQTTAGPVQSFGDLSANLDVQITPQISYEGLITMNIRVYIQQFTSTDISSGNRTEKTIETSVIMGNKEVLAFGGLMRDVYSETYNKVPILGDIPVVGWLFKYKAKNVIKSSLILLVTAEIIPPKDDSVAKAFTQEKIDDALKLTQAMHTSSERFDPVHRWFFKDCCDQSQQTIKDFTGKEERYIDPSLKARRTFNKKSISDLVPEASINKGDL